MATLFNSQDSAICWLIFNLKRNFIPQAVMRRLVCSQELSLCKNQEVKNMSEINFDGHSLLYDNY